MQSGQLRAKLFHVGKVGRGSEPTPEGAWVQFRLGEVCASRSEGAAY